MTSRDVPPHKNQSRVPLVLQAMDNPAAHHEPVHLLTEEGLMARTKIEKDGIYKDADDNFFFMAAGDFTDRDVSFVGARDEERKKPSAPENKSMPPASENRSQGSEVTTPPAPPEQAPEGGEPDLHKMTREELNSYAGWAGVTTDAESFSNKADLIAAIEAARAGANDADKDEGK